jgi:hypothetical protein
MLLQACNGISNVELTVLSEHEEMYDAAESWMEEAGLRQHQLHTLNVSVCGPEMVLGLPI